MESRLAVDLITRTHRDSKGNVIIGTIVSDDDTTLRSNCCNKSKGGLVDDIIPEPTFLADPSHRIKCMVKPIFRLVKKTKDPNSVKTIDALRLKKYLSCYIMQGRDQDFETFYNNRYAPLEYIFDNHAYCSPVWC